MIRAYVRSEDALLDETFYEDVVYLIQRLGYEVTSEDERLIGFLVDDSVQELLNETHQRHLPAGLRTFFIKRIVGRFYLKKIATTGVPSDFHFERAVSEVSEGGDRVVFADGSSAEDRFLACMRSYAEGGEEWIHYRRLAW
ncbi:MAG: hypothetical protein SOW18_01460 [Peptoniphilus sp.]|nr:hypothetical protein [Peptoniphilus sp.]MDY3118186.1 hypothetical protein [Peptoniphilus sp.]